MSEELSNCGGRDSIVPIKVNRVFDSCSDRDCLRNIAVTIESGELTENIKILKSKCIYVSDMCINVEAVPFNKGFYSIDITYTFSIELLAYEKACESPVTLKGVAYASKNCILYGSESATKTFFSDGTSVGSTNSCCSTVNLPTASVSIVEPIVLEAKIQRSCPIHSVEVNQCTYTPVITLGLFSVVELTRPVTVMVKTYNYTIPRKECCSDNETTPCEIFEKIKFPTEEFSPITIENTGECGCGFDCGFEES